MLKIIFSVPKQKLFSNSMISKKKKIFDSKAQCETFYFQNFSSIKKISQRVFFILPIVLFDVKKESYHENGGCLAVVVVGNLPAIRPRLQFNQNVW